MPTLPKIFRPITQNTLIFLFGLIITEIEIIDFAEGRAAEIKALEEVVNIAEGGKNVIQKLPRHMRRRAMSHNIKRLPKNLRAFATFQVSVLEALTLQETLSIHDSMNRLKIEFIAYIYILL